jgi:hypothetical protein
LSIQNSRAGDGDALQKANSVLGRCFVPDRIAHERERAIAFHKQHSPTALKALQRAPRKTSTTSRPLK